MPFSCDGQVVDIDLGRDLDAPVGGTKRSVAMKQVEGERHVLGHEELAEASEELRLARDWPTLDRSEPASGVHRRRCRW